MGRRPFLPWRAGYLPVAGTRQNLGSTISTIICLILMRVVFLMETFFQFWHSVVGSILVVVLMHLLMLIVDIQCIVAQPARMMRWRLKRDAGNAVQYQTARRVTRNVWRHPGNAVQTARRARKGVRSFQGNAAV